MTKLKRQSGRRTSSSQVRSEPRRNSGFRKQCRDSPTRVLLSRSSAWRRRSRLRSARHLRRPSLTRKCRVTSWLDSSRHSSTRAVQTNNYSSSRPRWEYSDPEEERILVSWELGERTYAMLSSSRKGTKGSHVEPTD